MALVPYTITAIERDTVDAATSGKQVVSGAVCTMTDSAGNVALMYDDAAGTNPSTAKTTNGNGQVVVFVYPDIYTLTTNGIARKVKVDGSITVEFETFAEISGAVVQEGQRVICRERANAEYIAQANGYVALAGDAVDSGGRVLALIINDTYNVLLFGATGDGVTDDTSAILSAISRMPIDSFDSSFVSGVLYFPATGAGYSTTSTINIPLGCSVLGDTAPSGYNDGIPPSFGSLIIANFTTGPVFQVTGTTLKGSNVNFDNIKISSANALYDGVVVYGALNGIKLNDVFGVKITGCTIERLAGSKGIIGTGNKITVSRCSIVKVGDGKSSLPFVGYTSGDAIDFEAAFDCIVENCFIETCGQFGIKVANNTKVSNCFVDLCFGGCYVTGERVQISNCNFKWHMTNGIFAESFEDLMISNTILTGNNYRSATTTSTAGVGLRIAGVGNYSVSNCNFIDDYETNAAHNGNKTVRQIDVHTGPAGAIGSFSNCSFSDPDGNITSYSDRIFDPNLNIPNLFVSLKNCQIESGLLMYDVNTSQLSAGTTLGAVTNFMTAYDKNGVIIGYVPVYDSIT